MARVIVEPLKQRKEIIAVSIAAVTIIVIAWLLIALRSDGNAPKLKLKYYQINAVKAFTESPADYKIFFDMYTTLGNQIKEHCTFKDVNTPVFPTIETLRAANKVPFLEGGLLYKKYGDHIWKKADLSNPGKRQFLNVYYGVSQKPNVAGSFLFIIKGVYQLDGTVKIFEYDNGRLIREDEPVGKYRIGKIWHKKGRHTIPADLSDGMLIKEGWKEVRNISGKDMRNAGGKK